MGTVKGLQVGLGQMGQTAAIQIRLKSASVNELSLRLLFATRFCFANAYARRISVNAVQLHI